MNLSDLDKAKDADLPASVAAMKRAAELARNIAIQTDTAIIVQQDGKLMRKTASELKAAATSGQ
jgi:hypothetical protein